MEQLILMHKGLVCTIARRYSVYLKSHENIEDLEQEGYIGIMRAVKSYVVDKGIKFSSYAGYWIRCYIRRAAIDSGHSMRIPESAQKRMTDICRERDRMYKETGVYPSVEQLADTFGLSEKSVIKAIVLSADSLSLDAPISCTDCSDGPFTLKHLLPDTTVQSPEEKAETEAGKKLLYQIIELYLDEQERMMLCMRYGLLDDNVHTCKEIGEKFGISGSDAYRTINTILGKIEKELRRQGLYEG